MDAGLGVELGVGVDSSVAAAEESTGAEVGLPEFWASPVAMSMIATIALKPATDKAMTSLVPVRELMALTLDDCAAGCRARAGLLVSDEVQSLLRTALNGFGRLADLFDIEDPRRDDGAAPTIESDQIGCEVRAHADATTCLRVERALEPLVIFVVLST